MPSTKSLGPSEPRPKEAGDRFVMRRSRNQMYLDATAGDAQAIGTIRAVARGPHCLLLNEVMERISHTL